MAAHANGTPTATAVTDDVIRLVAATVDEAPERLDPPLGTVIDPDALERLFRGRDAGEAPHHAFVSFTWAGCRVVVRASGEVEVSPLGDAAPVGAPARS